MSNQLEQQIKGFAEKLKTWIDEQSFFCNKSERYITGRYETGIAYAPEYDLCHYNPGYYQLSEYELRENDKNGLPTDVDGNYTINKIDHGLLLVFENTWFPDDGGYNYAERYQVLFINNTTNIERIQYVAGKQYIRYSEKEVINDLEENPSFTYGDWIDLTMDSDMQGEIAKIEATIEEATKKLDEALNLVEKSLEEISTVRDEAAQAVDIVDGMTSRIEDIETSVEKLDDKVFDEKQGLVSTVNQHTDKIKDIDTKLDTYASSNPGLNIEIQDRKNLFDGDYIGSEYGLNCWFENGNEYGEFGRSTPSNLFIIPVEKGKSYQFVFETAGVNTNYVRGGIFSGTLDDVKSNESLTEFTKILKWKLRNIPSNKGVNQFLNVSSEGPEAPSGQPDRNIFTKYVNNTGSDLYSGFVINAQDTGCFVGSFNKGSVPVIMQVTPYEDKLNNANQKVEKYYYLNNPESPPQWEKDDADNSAFNYGEIAIKDGHNKYILKHCLSQPKLGSHFYYENDDYDNLNTWRLYKQEIETQDAPILLFENSDCEGVVGIEDFNENFLGYVGGVHGYERLTEVQLLVDGIETPVNKAKEIINCQNATFIVKSNIYAITEQIKEVKRIVLAGSNPGHIDQITLLNDITMTGFEKQTESIFTGDGFDIGSMFEADYIEKVQIWDEESQGSRSMDSPGHENSKIHMGLTQERPIIGICKKSPDDNYCIVFGNLDSDLIFERTKRLEFVKGKVNIKNYWKYVGPNNSYGIFRSYLTGMYSIFDRSFNGFSTNYTNKYFASPKFYMLDETSNFINEGWSNLIDEATYFGSNFTIKIKAIDGKTENYNATVAHLTEGGPDQFDRTKTYFAAIDMTGPNKLYRLSKGQICRGEFEIQTLAK